MEDLNMTRTALLALSEDLKKLAETMPDDTPAFPWVPAKGCQYWTTDGQGRVFDLPWSSSSDDGDRTDQGSLAQGNVFRTKEEAERRAALIRLMQPKCARPKKREMGWGITVVGLGASYCTRYDASPGDVALWETGLWFPESQRAEAEAHAKSLNDFFSQEPTR